MTPQQQQDEWVWVGPVEDQPTTLQEREEALLVIASQRYDVPFMLPTLRHFDALMDFLTDGSPEASRMKDRLAVSKLVNTVPNRLPTERGRL